MSVASVYRHIIDDVIKNVKPEFANEGFPDQSLLELQQIWENKLLHSGAVLQDAEGYDRLYDASVHPQYSYISDSYNYGMPAPSMHSSSSTAVTQRAPYPAPAGHKGYAATHAPLPSFTNLAQPDFDAQVQLGRPQQYMPPPSNWPRAEPDSVNIKLATSKPGGRNASLPQHDGASDSMTQSSIDSLILQRLTANAAIPQYDGSGDKKSKKTASKKKVKQEEPSPQETTAGTGDGDEELDSDLDDPDDEEPETNHIVLCQFEKVTRIKNKRKCNLKDGVMHINGRDYLFNKANGEFDW